MVCCREALRTSFRRGTDAPSASDTQLDAVEREQGYPFVNSTLESTATRCTDDAASAPCSAHATGGDPIVAGDALSAAIAFDTATALDTAAACDTATALDGPSPLRTSQILRGILSNNPGVKTFSVQRILHAIGSDRIEASLMMFSIPGIVPVPRPRGLVTLPTGALGYQLLSGRKRITLPRAILKKSVTRRALAVAIHAILPVLEAAEKVMRPRWSWVSHSSSRRAIGLFVFLLALAIAFPLFGFNALHATSIFVMALGMAEQDGLAVLIGVAVGLLSLALLATSGNSARALRAKAGAWLRRIGKRLGLTAFAEVLRRRGYDRLARMLTLQWSDLLVLWNPEKTQPQRSTRVPNAKVPRAGKGLSPEPSGTAFAQAGAASRAA
jgi:hypothetical protein